MMTLKQQLRSIHNWNTKHPVGTKVKVTLDDGKVYTSAVQAPQPLNYNVFTGFGLVDAERAVRGEDD